MLHGHQQPPARLPGTQPETAQCPAQHVNTEPASSASGLPPQPPVSLGVGLLVLTYPEALGTHHLVQLQAWTEEQARKMGLTAMVVPQGVTVQVSQDLQPLVQAIRQQTQAMEALVVAMGQPEPSEPDPGDEHPELGMGTHRGGPRR